MNTKLFSTILDGYNMEVLQNLNMPIVSSYLKNKDITDRNFLFDLAMFASDVKFMKRSYQGPCKDLNDIILNNKNILIQSIKQVTDYKSLSYLLSRDFTLCSAINLFLEYKQIYEIDKSFIHDLIFTQSNTSTVPLNAFMHLPYNSFYINFEDTNICKYMYGCFVSIRVYDKNLEILAQIIGRSADVSQDTSENYFGTHLCRVSLDYNDTDVDKDSSDIQIGINTIDGYNDIDLILSLLHDTLPGSNNWDYLFMWYVIVPFILYLNSYKSDIRPKKVSKTTTHKKDKSDKIQNCNISEVGYTYGCTLRTNKISSKNLYRQIESIHIESGKRSHMRRAHWHRFKYGPGKKQEKLIWLPPMYIQGSKLESITMHKVKS